MVKVIVNLPDKSWHGLYSESLWAEPIEQHYRIQNIPFYTKELSFEDEISVIEKDGELYYKSIIKESGNSTYRIFNTSKDIEEFDFYLNLINDIGCVYEKATENLFAINVPQSVDIYKVYEIFELGEKRNVWEFEEGHFEHKLKESTN